MMIMVANIGNSVITFGFFENSEGKMISSFKISSDIRKTSDEYLTVIKSILNDRNINAHDIDGAILSSVVPQLTNRIKETMRAFSGKDPLVVGPGVKTGFHIKIDNPSELGGDMVANTAAAIRLKKANKGAIVADLGAVNTISAIGKSGEYLGCVIFPGIQLSLDVLHGQTAQLPNINFSDVSSVIGKNSSDSLRSGVVFSSAFAIDGFVDRFAKEMKCEVDDLSLIVTGEYAYAKTLLPECKSKFCFDEHLTLKGLYYIYNNTVSK